MEGKQDKLENCTICKLQPSFGIRICTDIYPGTLSVTRTKHSMSEDNELQETDKVQGQIIHQCISLNHAKAIRDWATTPLMNNNEYEYY